MSEETMLYGEIKGVLVFDAAISPQEIESIMERTFLQLV
jgi:hypothetical protein